MTVNSSGTETVASGGTASGTTVSGGGNQYVSGTASGSVLNHGTETVSSGGLSISGTVNSGGQETVLSGGTTTSMAW